MYVLHIIHDYIIISIMNIEQEFVLDVYENIADHFSDTRFSRWDFITQFLKKQSPSDKGIEIGCGNGRNLCIRDDLNIIGVDTCQSFIDICIKKKLIVFRQNCCELSFPNASFDYAYAIAVFHHLASELRRYKAMKEMIRILKPGGKGIISVWSLEQTERDNNMKMRRFVPGDNYVPWVRKRDKKIFKRYYYIFDEDMFQTYINQFSEHIVIHRIINKRGNWIVEFTKK